MTEAPEAIGGDQGAPHAASAEDDVVDRGLGVAMGAAAEHTTGPQAGTHLDRRKQPQGAALAADERAACIRLQLNDVEIAQQPVIEARGSCRGSLEPSRDGGAGMARHSGGRRSADALDS